MAFRVMWSGGAVALAAVSAWTGCGGDVRIEFGAGGEGGLGGSGGSGTGTTTGTATGSGTGTATGTATGSGTGAVPCSVDCSTIATPPCYVAVCDEQTDLCQVVPAEAGASCDDGMFCTISDACDGAGQCVGGAENTCGIVPEDCELVTCNEQTSSCSTVPGVNGMPCTSPDLCTVDAICQGGICAGQPKDCFFTPVPDECHVPICDPMDGQCKPVPGNDGGPCTDPNDLCTDGKICSSGSCVGGLPKDCSAQSVGCNEGVCNANTGQCVQQPLMAGDPCAEGTDACNQGTCDGTGSCVSSPINEGGMCDDGLSCTTGTTCTGGTCGGGTSTVSVYFSESFSSNAAGWTLGTEWQIGSAMASTGHTSACGNGDPATDHSPGNDNGVAGVVIGGNATPMVHPYYYLTSPPVNVAGQSSVYLEYWRWLNSDYTPFMENRVEVFDGSSWVTLFVTGGPPVTDDSSWIPQSFDITPYANANLQVRFGFTIGQGGVYTCSGWNVDDVAILSGPCN